METLLRKYLSLVDLAVVALCAIFAARATATAIEAGFVSGIPTAKHAPKPPASPTRDHGLFEAGRGDPQSEHLLLDLPADPGRQRRRPAGRRRRPRSSGPRCRSSCWRSCTPRPTRSWSMAIIRDNDDKSVGPYGVGSHIREATIDLDRRDARLSGFRRREAGVPGAARRAGDGRRCARGGRAFARAPRIRWPKRSTKGSRRRAPTATRSSTRRSTRSSETWARCRRRRGSSPR